MVDNKPTNSFPKLDFLAQCLLTMLQDIEGRKPCSFYVTRAQIDQLLNDPTIEPDSSYLVQLQRVLIDKGAAFLSLPSGGKHTYFVCSANDPLFAKAAAVGENQIKRVTKTQSMDIDAIRALADYGFAPADLARTTCASIGHSSISLGTKAANGITHSCLRCGRKLKAAQITILRDKFVESPSALVLNLPNLTWRDTVNMPRARMEAFAVALHTLQPDTELHSNLIVDPDALAMVPGVTVEKKKSKPASSKSTPKSVDKKDKPKKGTKTKKASVKQETSSKSSKKPTKPKADRASGKKKT